MKKVLACLLCLCMLLPLATVFVSAEGTAVVADDPLSNEYLQVEKLEFVYGEPVNVKALQGGDSDRAWIGIAPKGKENDGYGRWCYAKDAANAYYDLRNGVSGNLSGESAALGVGEWVIYWAPSGGASNRAVASEITITISAFVTDKEIYNEGEAIMVTASTVVAADDWIGIVPVVNGTPYYTNGTIRWTYIDGKQSNGVGALTAFDMRKAYYTAGNTEMTGIAQKMGKPFAQVPYLPAGEYMIVFVPQNKGVGGGANVKYTKSITVLDNTFSLAKTTFTYGEPILVTPYGVGKDWVGISPVTDAGFPPPASLRWKYIEAGVGNATDGSLGAGAGVAVDMRTAKPTATYAHISHLPVGEYWIYVAENDGEAKNLAEEHFKVRIQVVGESGRLTPAAPTSAVYHKLNATSAFAGGSVAVTLPANVIQSGEVSHVVLYWADDNGKLSDYTYLQRAKATGTSLSIELQKQSVIPAEATRLLVFSENAFGESEDCISIPLSERDALVQGELITSFQIVSDIHITGTDGHVYDSHTPMMFEDIKALDPNSAGIFVVGDAADQGQAHQYEKLYALWQQHMGGAGFQIPLFLSMGNHEYMKGDAHNYGGDYQLQVERFLEYAQQHLPEEIDLSKQYYDFWLNGYHYIFLGSEAIGTHAYLSDAQLRFLANALAENRNASRPTFVFLHQPLYDTVAGGVPGQGWNGVIAGDANWAAFQAGGSVYRKVDGTYEGPLRAILAQYPEILMFGGHSHWIMQSHRNMSDATDSMPNMFNTASVAYLWTDKNVTTGENEVGSQGYYVRVYDHYVELYGRDFVNGKWIPTAMYRVELAEEGFLKVNGTAQDAVGATLSGYAVSFGDQVGFDVYLELNEALANDEKAAVVFEFEEGEVVILPLATATTVERGGVTYYVVTCPVAAAEMSNEVTVTVVAGNGIRGTAHKQSLVSCAQRTLVLYEDLGDVTKALLNYGAYTQRLFGYKPLSIVNRVLAPEDRVVETATVDAAYRAVKSGSEEGIAYLGSALVLNGKIAVRHFFAWNGEQSMDAYSFTVNGNACLPVACEEGYYVEVADIGMTALGEAHTLTVGGFSLTYSAMSYLRAVLHQPEAFDPNLVAALSALAHYAAYTSVGEAPDDDVADVPNINIGVM